MKKKFNPEKKAQEKSLKLRDKVKVLQNGRPAGKGKKINYSKKDGANRVLAWSKKTTFACS